MENHVDTISEIIEYVEMETPISHGQNYQVWLSEWKINKQMKNKQQRKTQTQTLTPLEVWKRYSKPFRASSSLNPLQEKIINHYVRTVIFKAWHKTSIQSKDNYSLTKFLSIG